MFGRLFSMMKHLGTIVALALCVPAASVPAHAATPRAAVAKPAKRAAPKPPARRAAPAPQMQIAPSADALRVTDWIAVSHDNGALPYIVVDKRAAALFLFSASGEPLGTVPVLLGIAPGDDATPGVGSKTLAEIGPSEKTTPAGRFLAKFGLAAGRQKVLWVDYATSVALHPIPADSKAKEQRRQRMLSPDVDDNRITFGCINVPSAFYSRTLRPLFAKKGGYVYVLPEAKPLETVFPRLHVHALASAGVTR